MSASPPSTSLYPIFEHDELTFHELTENYQHLHHTYRSHVNRIRAQKRRSFERRLHESLQQQIQRQDIFYFFLVAMEEQMDHVEQEIQFIQRYVKHKYHFDLHDYDMHVSTSITTDRPIITPRVRHIRVLPISS